MFSTSNVSFSVSSSALNVLEEVAVTISPMDSQIIVWNIRTGAVLRNFKNTSSKTCAFLQNSYLLCPQKDKPQIFSYSWEREQIDWKGAIPESLEVVTCSDDGRYCAGGSSTGTIYLWETSTGNLLAQWKAHFQNISSLKFLSGQTEFLISGGKDSLLHSWLLSSIFEEEVSPYRSWSAHTLPITQIISYSKNQFISSSLDHTCKLWNIQSENSIASIIFPSALSSVAINSEESLLFAGGLDGKIYGVELMTQNARYANKLFVGHTKAITSLSCSTDGSLLLSTSDDFSSQIWDTKSCQSLRIFTQHKGSVTFGEIRIISRELLQTTKSPSKQPLSIFKKFKPDYPIASNLIYQNESLFSSPSPLLNLNLDLSSRSFLEQQIPLYLVSSNKNAEEQIEKLNEKVNDAEGELERWKSIGQKLYLMKVSSINNNSNNISSNNNISDI